MKQSLIEIFSRDILRLIKEMKCYKNENNIWVKEPNISNSAGNLCLHLAGNLNHFIGAILGNNGYVRNREEEFAKNYVPFNELIDMIERTSVVVINTLRGIDEQGFRVDFPVKFLDQSCTTDLVLIHLAGHLNYHLGQINYHRRLLDK